jgi:mRNA interferase MazF
VLIVQADHYNQSQIGTVVVAVVTSKTQAAEMPGNVFLPSSASGLARDSVINVSQLVTVDRDALGERVGQVPAYVMEEVRFGLRRVLDL